MKNHEVVFGGVASTSLGKYSYHLCYLVLSP